MDYKRNFTVIQIQRLLRPVKWKKWTIHVHIKIGLYMCMYENHIYFHLYKYASYGYKPMHTGSTVSHIVHVVSYLAPSSFVFRTCVALWSPRLRIGTVCMLLVRVCVCLACVPFSPFSLLLMSGVGCRLGL